MKDRTIVVYWRWAWLGIVPGVYLSAVTGNTMFLFGVLVVYVGAGISAAVASASTGLPAATVGALAWVAMMVLMVSKYLPLAEMWRERGEPGIWAAAYVAGGAAAVLFLGISMDPIYTRRASSEPKTLPELDTDVGGEKTRAGSDDDQNTTT